MFLTTCKSLLVFILTSFLFILIPVTTAAQTITIVGTSHLNHLTESPTTEQLDKAIEAMAAFEPTQVCVERMGGERIEMLHADPSRHGRLLESFVSRTVRMGEEMQRRLAIRPADARFEAEELIEQWDELDVMERGRLIGLQIAGFEFVSAVLNWSYLTPENRETVSRMLGTRSVESLNNAMVGRNEIFSLAVPLARKAGLHQMCFADSLEDEVAGVAHIRRLGYDEISQNEEFQNRIEELRAFLNRSWQPESGPDALVQMLKEYNSEKWAATDRELQWETLHMFDNEKGATIGRLMYWHARTSEINAELYRALARGPDERVLFIVGSAHRPFNEAALRSQPWVEVKPAVELFK
jgi:hypothetical protein